MKTLERLGRELYRDDVAESPSLMEVISGKKELPIGSMLKSFARSKARKLVDKYIGNVDYSNPASKNLIMPMDPGYHLVKNTVESALNGESRYDIREVSHVPGGNLGMHDYSGIRILKADRIPDVFGRSYEGTLKRAGKPPEEFNQNVQDYIKLHEIAEREYMDKYGMERLNDDEHGRFESYLLRSLETLPSDGYNTAGILEGAIATHSMRSPRDSFLQKTKKYMRNLGDRIDEFLSRDYRPFAQAYAYAR